MKYTVDFIGNSSGVSSSNGPVFETTRKREAIAHARHAARKHAGHPDFRGGWYEVSQNEVRPSQSWLVFQSKTLAQEARP